MKLVFHNLFCIIYFVFTFALDASTKPNILLIVSEDNGPELGCYGEPFVRTPVLDNLASEGVLFKNAFVPQAGCSQSRAALLTGLYPHQNGQIGLATWKFSMYSENTPNIVNRLRKSGYRTGIIGKLHINPSSAFHFDYFKIPSSNFARKQLELYSQYAAEFINASDEPFFLSLNFPDAHRPFIAQVDGIPSQPLNSEDVKPLRYFGLDSPELRKQTANHYNCMSRLDTLIGDVLEKLKRSHKANNTLVLYMGDHGADMLRGKRTSYEGGTRIPLIVKYPGLQKSGQIRNELVSSLDIAPTLIEAAGAEPMNNLPGKSLLNLIQGHNVEWRKYLFTEFHTHSAKNYFPQRSVRSKRYKLIHNLLYPLPNPGHQFTLGRFFSELDITLQKAPQKIQKAYKLMESPPQFELYDLLYDPFEFNNLSHNPKYSHIEAELRKELMDWRQKTKDPLLNQKNLLKLKAEIDACIVDGVSSKKRLNLNYQTYFFNDDRD